MGGGRKWRRMGACAAAFTATVKWHRRVFHSVPFDACEEREERKGGRANDMGRRTTSDKVSNEIHSHEGECTRSLSKLVVIRQLLAAAHREVKITENPLNCAVLLDADHNVATADVSGSMQDVVFVECIDGYESVCNGQRGRGDR